MLHIIFLIQKVVDLSKPGVQTIIVDPPFKNVLKFLDLLDDIQYFDKKTPRIVQTNKHYTCVCSQFLGVYTSYKTQVQNENKNKERSSDK